MRKVTLLLLLLTLALVSMGSDCGDKPPADNAGFTVRTYREDIDTITGQFNAFRDPHRTVQGTWNEDKDGARGDKFEFGPVKSDMFGDIPVANGRAPANWMFGEFDGACTNKTVNLDVQRGKLRALTCFVIRGFIGFASRPQILDANAPPSSVQIVGEGFDATYGMPMVQYYDANGTLIAEAQATSISSDGTWLDGPTPDLSSVESGIYSVVIRNMLGGGPSEVIGALPVEVIGYVPPPEECRPDGTCAEWDSVNCYCMRT